MYDIFIKLDPIMLTAISTLIGGFSGSLLSEYFKNRKIIKITRLDYTDLIEEGLALVKDAYKYPGEDWFKVAKPYRDKLALESKSIIRALVINKKESKIFNDKLTKLQSIIKDKDEDERKKPY